MKYIFMLFLTACLFFASCTPLRWVLDGPDSYHVGNIPEEVRKDADAVVLYERIRLNITDNRKAEYTVYRAVTIYNDDGRSHGLVALSHDDFNQLRVVNGAVFDASGNLVRRLNKKEILETSEVTSMINYDDSRITRFVLTHTTFPYTVVYEFTMDRYQSLNYPGWAPQWGRMPVVESYFEVRAPTGYPLRFHAEGELGEPVQSTEGGFTEYRWELRNRAVPEEERFSPPWVLMQPRLRLATDAFRIGETWGRADSWEDFGKWYYELSQDRQTLPESELAMVNSVVETAGGDTLEIIRALYRHVQSSTRYVAVSFGIGGHQTYPAEYVVRNRFGDCKALTNYLHSLLIAAGIKSYPALIRSDDWLDAVPEFSSNQFNHVILAVPYNGELIWIECTSNTYPLGYIGRGNSGKHALLISETGGRLVRTPDLNAEQNLMERSLVMHLDHNGNASMSMTTVYRGFMQDHPRAIMNLGSPRDVRNHLDRLIPFTNYTLKDFTFTDVPEEAALKLTIDFDVKGFASRSQSRLVVLPNLVSRTSLHLPESDERRFPIVSGRPRAYMTDVQINLPDGFSVEYLPDPQTLEFPFADYSFMSEVTDERTIRHVRTSRFHERELPAELYEDFRQYIRSITQADNVRIVLVRTP
jgi:transglutaminase-like putative cysteine protease